MKRSLILKSLIILCLSGLLVGCDLRLSDLFPKLFGSSSQVITGAAFQDDNGDGVQQPGEMGFPDIVVKIYCDPYHDSANQTPQLISEGRTDAQGKYSFVMPIKYDDEDGKRIERVCWAEIVVPSGYRRTSPNNANPVGLAPVTLTTAPEEPSPVPEPPANPKPNPLPRIIQNMPGLPINQPGVEITPGGFSIWDFPYAGYSTVKAAYTMGTIKIYQGMDVYYQTITDPAQALYIPADWERVESIPSLGDYSAFSVSDGKLMGGYVAGKVANWFQFSGADNDTLVQTAKLIMPGVAQSPPPVLELPKRSAYGAPDQQLFSQSFTSIKLGDEAGQATVSFSTSQAIHLQMEPAGDLSGYASFATIFDNNGDFVMTSWVVPGEGDINLGNSPFAGHFEMVVALEQLPDEAGGATTAPQVPMAVLPYDVAP